MGSVKSEPVFVPQHERAKAWKMRALERTVRQMRSREKDRADAPKVTK